MNDKPKKDVKILFVNCCLRKNANTKLLPVGLGYVMTYFQKNDYKFTLLDIDINEYSDSYVEDYISNNETPDQALTSDLLSTIDTMTQKQLDPFMNRISAVIDFLEKK